MPEAVASNSIPAYVGQPSSSVDLQAFSDTVRKGEALSMMLGALLQQPGSLHEDIASGVSSLFDNLVQDFRTFYEETARDQKIFFEFTAYDRAMMKLRSDRIEFSEDEAAFNSFSSKEKNKNVHFGMKIHPLAKLELERAASHHRRSVQNMAAVIICQWLVREGWLKAPETDPQEASE